MNKQKKINKANNKINPEKAVNHSLLNIITPIGGIEFQRNKIYMGENVMKVYAITKYPQEIDIGWISKISNIPRAISTQIYEPCSNVELLDYLSKSISQNKGIVVSTKDELQRERAEKAVEAAKKLIEKIDTNNETVGYMTNLIMPVANDEKTLDRTCRTVESTLASMSCKVRVLSNLQEQAFKTIAPFHHINDEITNIARRNVPVSTFFGGFPFASVGFSDREGYYFAKDLKGGLVIVDSWKRDEDRTNSNYVVFGVPGVGKSTTVKHILTSEFAYGTKLIMFDIDEEYQTLVRNFKGEYIDCCGGKNGKINVLQIKSVPQDDEEDEYENDKYSDMVLYNEDESGQLSLHMINLEIFFKLYAPDITVLKLLLLKKILEDTYNEFGINWLTNTSNFKNDQFPIFSDVYKTAHKYYEEDDSEDMKYVYAMLRELSEGSHSFIFNGHTTMDPKSRAIGLNTSKLNDAGDNIKKAAYFNTLSWVWELASNDINEKVLTSVDEAYTYIDKNVPQTLIFLRNFAKRIRKYEGGLMVISHSVVDFLDPSIKQWGQALLDLPAYKIIMGTDGQNLKELTELYNLNEIEQEFLMKKKKKQALFLIGFKRMFVKFDIPKYKLDLMGKKGGR